MGTFYDREIEYLESTGSQYIDTGVVGSSDLSIVLKCYYPASSASLPNTGFILASRVANGDRQYGIIHSYSGNFRYGNAASDSWANPTDRVLVFDNTESHNILKVFDTDNNLVTTLTATAATFNNNLNIVLFGLNNNGTIRETSNRIYSLKMYEGTTLVRDFIPVRVGQVGYMFDRVTCQLFGNAGTGSFTLGADMYDARVEYVGIRKGQYILTDYVPAGTDIAIDTSITFRGYPTTANYTPWYVARVDASHACYRFIRSTANNTIIVNNCNNDSGNKVLSFQPSSGTTYNILSFFGTLVINHTSYTTNTTYTTETNTAVISLGDGSATRGINEDVHHFKIYKSGVLVLDLVPVRKGQVGYLYDRVSNQVFGNSGTGSLLIGNDIPEIPTDYDAEVDYLVFDGTQSIDTGLHGDLNTYAKVTCKPTIKPVYILGSYTNSGRFWMGINVYGRYWNQFQNGIDGDGGIKYDDGDFYDWAEFQTSKDLRQIRLLNKRGFVTASNVIATEFTTPNTLKVGGYDGASGMYSYHNFVGYMGTVQIKKNNVLVRDMIPVRKNGVGYLYDKITGKMFGNEYHTSIGIGKDKVKPLPVLRRLNNCFTRQDLIVVNAEEVYDGNARWEYDTTHMSTKYPYHGGRIWVEMGWCYLNNPSTGKIKWYATNVSGRHKTLDVKEGQKYLIQACEDFQTSIAFVNDHVFAASGTRDAYCLTIAAGKEQVVTVPAGFQYMMIHAWRQTDAEMRFPDRVSRILGYG